MIIFYIYIYIYILGPVEPQLPLAQFSLTLPRQAGDAGEPSQKRQALPISRGGLSEAFSAPCTRSASRAWQSLTEAGERMSTGVNGCQRGSTDANGDQRVNGELPTKGHKEKKSFLYICLRELRWGPSNKLKILTWGPLSFSTIENDFFSELLFFIAF